MRVLSGTWKAARGDFYNRSFHALASTDWRRFPEHASAAWTLWGLERAVGSFASPTFALAMSIDPGVPDSALNAGGICLLRQDDSSWSCVGQAAARIGSWKPSDPVGTRGVDPVRREAWAVVDRTGTYAVSAAGGVGAHRAAAGGVARLQGRLLELPAAWAGRTVRIEVFDSKGRLLRSGTTRNGSWELDRSLRGFVRIRALRDGAEPILHGAVLLP